MRTQTDALVACHRPLRPPAGTQISVTASNPSGRNRCRARQLRRSQRRSPAGRTAAAPSSPARPALVQPPPLACRSGRRSPTLLPRSRRSATLPHRLPASHPHCRSPAVARPLSSRAAVVPALRRPGPRGCGHAVPLRHRLGMCPRRFSASPAGTLPRRPGPCGRRRAVPLHCRISCHSRWLRAGGVQRRPGMEIGVRRGDAAGVRGGSVQGRGRTGLLQPRRGGAALGKAGWS